MDREEQIERCKREVEACRLAGQDPDLTPAQKLGAIQGEVDWLVALRIAEEQLRGQFPVTLLPKHHRAWPKSWTV